VTSADIVAALLRKERRVGRKSNNLVIDISSVLILAGWSYGFRSGAGFASHGRSLGYSLYVTVFRNAF
jgi:hypothetical protein